MAELAKIPNVRAVKQAHDDLDQARRIPELGLDLYAGDDNLIFPFLGLGGSRRHLRAHARLGPQTKEMVRRWKRGRRRGRAEPERRDAAGASTC